jgi:hypothetical protein
VDVAKYGVIASKIASLLKEIIEIEANRVLVPQHANRDEPKSDRIESISGFK